MPATTKKNVQPSNTIEYQRTVINEMADDLHSIFTGTAAINAASIQLAGADIGNISDVDDKTIFFYYGGFTANTTVTSPAKIAFGTALACPCNVKAFCTLPLCDLTLKFSCVLTELELVVLCSIPPQS